MRPFDFLTFSNKLLIDNWLRISKNVNHISDHGFKCLLGSVISTDKSYSKVPLRLCLYTFFRKICQLPIYFRYIIPGMLIDLSKIFSQHRIVSLFLALRDKKNWARQKCCLPIWYVEFYGKKTHDLSKCRMSPLNFTGNADLSRSQPSNSCYYCISMG